MISGKLIKLRHIQDINNIGEYHNIRVHSLLASECIPFKELTKN